MLYVMTPATYSDLFDHLERDNIRYVVVGGVAVVLHGYNRPISDLDLVIDREPTQARRAMHTLMAAGFVPTIAVPLSAVSMLRLIDRTHREVDLFLRYCIGFEELWKGSELVRVSGSIVRVISLEDLMREKEINKRAQDKQDIEKLLMITGGSGSGGQSEEREEEAGAKMTAEDAV